MSVRRFGITLLTWWLMHDVDGAVDWVQSEPELDPRRKEDYMRKVLLFVGQNDPQKAMETALKHQKSEYLGAGLPYDAMVIRAVTELDVRIALDLMKFVSPKHHLTAYRAVGRTLIANGDYETAMSLFDRLKDSELDEYMNYIAQQWVDPSPILAAEALRDIQNTKFRSILAHEIYSTNSSRQTLGNKSLFTVSQLSYLESFLTDEEIDAIHSREQLKRERLKRVVQ